MARKKQTEEDDETPLRRYGRLCERMIALEEDSEKLHQENKRLHAKVNKLEERLALAEAKVGLR